MVNEMTKVKVRFTQQQIQILNTLKKEGKFGTSYEDVILNVFRNYMRHIDRFPEYIRRRFHQGGL